MKISSLLLTLLIIFSSCSSDDVSLEENELNNARALWQSHGINDYKWNERKNCFCAGILEKDVFVVNKIKDKVTFEIPDYFADNDYDEMYSNVLQEAKTVEEAFGFIEELLSRQDFDSLVVEYDEIYGYPTLIRIDYIKEAVDDEVAYSYSNLEILNVKN